MDMEIEIEEENVASSWRRERLIKNAQGIWIRMGRLTRVMYKE